MGAGRIALQRRKRRRRPCSTSTTARAHGSKECSFHSGPSSSVSCLHSYPSSSGYVPIPDSKCTHLLSTRLQRFSFPAPFRSPNRRNSTNGVILIVSAVCTVLSVTEIILFAASRLHPLTYLLLQLVKMITWFALFVQAAVDTTRVQNEMGIADKQGYSLGDRSEYFYLQWFAEPLVLL